ncbi:LysR substrate-binding domain-containing protein, partial [Acinetobacter baumannii]
TFLAQHPQLEIELSASDRRVDLVAEGFDCVLRTGTLDDSSLVARPIGHLVQINCASAAYLKRHGTPRSLEDLAHHQLVHYRQV